MCSSCLGGHVMDWGKGVAVDETGRILVIGKTFSPGWVWGGGNTTYDGAGDAFLASSRDVSARVLRRRLFYNRSARDGNDPAADSQDDSAMAIDQRALLTGETATFANYTSYVRGINGIMVDIANLAGRPQG